MICCRAAALVSLLATAPGFALGQSADAAAERARLGNERMQAEADRGAREEAELQNRASDTAAALDAAPAGPTPAQAISSPPTAPRGPPAADDRTEQGLARLREFGKLKDACYLTDAEFQRIKQRILDSHF